MNKNLVIFALGCAVIIGGCDSVKEQAGLTQSAPDEFKVVKRAPLTLPPNYVLRPPRPGAPRPQEQSTSQQAADVVFGNTPQQAAASSAPVVTDGESALLSRAGSSVVDPDIRRRVDSETADLSDRNKPVAQKLFGIGGARDEVSASVVNAKKEAERLKSNAEDGKAVTDGETPSIEE